MNIPIKSFFTLFALLLSQAAFGWGDSSSSSSYSSYSSRDSSYSGSSYGGSSSTWTQEECRSCHDDPVLLPYLKYKNPDKHHRLIGTRVRHSTAPNSAIDDYYECTTCHIFAWSDETQEMSLVAERECTVCHDLSTVTGGFRNNRHMSTGNYNCSVCHSRIPGDSGSSWGR